MTIGETSSRRERARPLRSFLEIAVIAAYLVLVPPLLEMAFATAGIPTTGLMRIVATGGLFLGLIAVVAVLLALHGETMRDLGLRWPDSVVVTLITGVMLAASLFAALEQLKLMGVMDETRLGDMASELKGNPTLALARIGLSVLVVGFVEELLFRGFIFDRLAKSFGGGLFAVVLAAQAQALLFGVSHAYQGMQGIAFTGAVGLVFAIVFLAAGRNLWPVIIAHALFDAARGAYLYVQLTGGA
jgi:membrane protease YdiL (CAAX protease family)